MTVPTVTLNDHTTIPQLGFGVFQVPAEDTAATVTSAFEAGYRHIDTAQMYGNEAGVGEAIASSGLSRGDLYVTTKLNNNNHRPDDVKRSFDESLAKLGLDHVDLFLVHWPLPTKYDGDYVSTWKAMAELVTQGGAKSVGVSNFNPDHLDRIVAETGVLPVVNQIEAHPYFTNDVTREASLAHGVKIEAWSPIAQGKILDDQAIGEIAKKHSKTPSQVTLRWHIERGDIVFPKSMKAERMAENFDLFDFSLSSDEVATITALGGGTDGRIGPDPAVFDMIPD
ncbi:aldo/keto reductase [Nocardioides salsibiostraticola]